MILKKCVTLQFCAKLLCTELIITSEGKSRRFFESDGYIG